MSVGKPIKLLYEGLGHIVTVELKSGSMYRGVLDNVEDNMNCLMHGVTVTNKDGRISALEQIYIRGSNVRLMVFPDMLRHAPMFRSSPSNPLVMAAKLKTKQFPMGGMKRALQMRGHGDDGGDGSGRGGRGGRGGDRGDRGRSRGN